MKKQEEGGFIFVMKRIWVDISTHISFYDNGAKCWFFHLIFIGIGIVENLGAEAEKENTIGNVFHQLLKHFFGQTQIFLYRTKKFVSRLCVEKFKKWKHKCTFFRISPGFRIWSFLKLSVSLSIFVWAKQERRKENRVLVSIWDFETVN